MTMTKRDFVALADTVVAQYPLRAVRRVGERVQWERMRDALADFCASQNPAFDRERWLAYIYDSINVEHATLHDGD